MCANELSGDKRIPDILEILSVTSRKMRTLFDARVREEGLTLPRARVLMNLQRHTQLAQKELAEALEIEGPTLVRLLDKMEEQDWIARISVDGDRRAKHVILTAQGRVMAKKVFAIVDDMRGQILRTLTEEQIGHAAIVLSIIGSNLAGLVPSDGSEI